MSCDHPGCGKEKHIHFTVNKHWTKAYICCYNYLKSLITLFKACHYNVTCLTLWLAIYSTSLIPKPSTSANSIMNKFTMLSQWIAPKHLSTWAQNTFLQRIRACRPTGWVIEIYQNINMVRENKIIDLSTHKKADYVRVQSNYSTLTLHYPS